ncbi:MAG: hypothetical protein ABL998_11865, partial [Planctomycetota bacterium]
MHPSAKEEHARLAMAIADGEAIDWKAIAAAGVLPPNEIRALQELEALRILPPDELAALTPGHVVGDFELVAKIGSGGMGEVWE